MEDVEDVEDEAKVTIHLPEPGPIGRPIVQVRKSSESNAKAGVYVCTPFKYIRTRCNVDGAIH